MCMRMPCRRLQERLIHEEPFNNDHILHICPASWALVASSDHPTLNGPANPEDGSLREASEVEIKGRTLVSPCNVD